jgi:hypothetical protein
MIANTFIQALICEHCKIALNVDEVPGHLHGKHKNSGFQVDKIKLDEVVKELNIEGMLPDVGAGPLPEVSGLKLQKGLLCPKCGQVVGTENSMGKHYSGEHKGVKKPKVFKTAFYQQFNQGSGSGRAIFQVEPKAKEPVSPDDVLVATLRSETDQTFQEDMDLADINARQVSPWLLTTKWHLHVDGLDPKELIELVKPLNDKEAGQVLAKRLVPLVKQYYDQATALIAQTDCLTLQHLNTPDPMKTYVNYNLGVINVSNECV